jgi:hypothetical protein
MRSPGTTRQVTERCEEHCDGTHAGIAQTLRAPARVVASPKGAQEKELLQRDIPLRGTGVKSTDAQIVRLV